MTGIIFGGCTGLSGTKYQAGDVISFKDGYQEIADVILDYDKTSDKYLVTTIYRDDLGRWGRASIDTKKWADRDTQEMLYIYKLGHVNIEDLKMVTL